MRYYDWAAMEVGHQRENKKGYNTEYLYQRTIRGVGGISRGIVAEIEYRWKRGILKTEYRQG